MATQDSIHKNSASTAPRSLGRVTRAGVLWAYLRTGFFALIGLPTAMILARLLTPADFGIAAVATFFGQMAARLSNGGMGLALVRLKEVRDEHISSVFVAHSVLAGLGAMAILAGASLIAAFYRTPELVYVMPVVALDVAISSLCMIPQALLTRDMRYRDMAVIASADKTTAAFGAVVLAWFGFGYWSIVLGALAGSVVRWAWGASLMGPHFSFRFVPNAAREMATFASGSYTKGLLEYFSGNVDNVIIGRVLGVTALGFYDKAFSTMARAYGAMTTVGPSISFRAFAALQDEPARFRRAFAKVTLTAVLVGYPAFAALGTTAPHLIVVLFGPKWQASVVPFQLLCVAGALRMSTAYGSAAANAHGWVWSNVWRQCLNVLAIVVGVYLAASWGINGASAAVLGAAVLMFVLMHDLLRKATGLSWWEQVEPQLPALLLSAALVALLWGINEALRALTSNPGLILVAQALVAGLLAIVYVRWCPFAAVREVAQEIAGDISPRLVRLLGGTVPPKKRDRTRSAI